MMGFQGQAAVYTHRKTQKKYAFKQGFRQPFTLTLSAHRPPLGEKAPRLSPHTLTALLLMVEYGTLGAGDQYGCGLVDFCDMSDRKKLADAVLHPSGSIPPQTESGLSLQDFFFFKGKLKASPKVVEVLLSTPRAASLNLS